MLPVEPPHHPPLFFSRELGEILLAQGFGKNFQSMKSQYAPTAIACFNQRFEFALGVAPVQEFVNQGTVDLSGAILSHPYFFELAHP